MEPEASMPEADDYTPESYDEYLTAEVLLPNMGIVTKAKVIGRKRDQDGNPIGKRNANPILDTREYKVEFQDGATDTFTANIIAENLYSQVDSEGNSFSILDEIVITRATGRLCQRMMDTMWPRMELRVRSKPLEAGSYWSLGRMVRRLGFR